MMGEWLRKHKSIGPLLIVIGLAVMVPNPFLGSVTLSSGIIVTLETIGD